MLITKIEKQKTQKNRYSIFIDGEFSFGLDEIDLLYYKLKENDIIDKKTYDYIIDNIIFEKAKKVATNYLGYKMRSEQQVIKKLKSAEFSEEIVIKVINVFKKYGYIDDYNFAKLFLRDKMQISKHGSLKIKSDLKLNGVDSDIINKVLYENELDELEIAISLIEKKTIRKNLKNLDFKEKQKLISYLVRRGFPYDISKLALNEILLK